MLKHRALFLGLMAVLVAGFALGSEAIPNWAAPATWSPPRSEGVHTMTDITFMLPFIGVTPCRIWDTRGNGFLGQYGPPAIAANTQRTFTIAGQCGIPATAQAVSFNIGALNVGAAGDLRVFPAGGAVPLVSTLNYNANTPNIANAAVVPLGAGGAITLQADATAIDSIGDVNGYYAPTPAAAGNVFIVEVTSGPFAIGGANDSTAASVNGVLGEITSATPGGFSTGVRGINSGTAGNGIGVWGSQNGSGWGVNGTVVTGIGVRGVASGTSGTGVVGSTSSTASFANGIFGRDGVGLVAAPFAPVFSVGVVGHGQNGVIGRSDTPGGWGTSGQTQTTAGVETSLGVLGDGTAGHGVWAYVGDIGCSSCTKAFVDPHPTDPSKEIRFVSLEGNEAGTYFRGTAETVGREFVIQVPEDFRLVTDPEDLTVQLTPVGAPATMYVVSEDLNQIVVRSSRDVQFHYLVNGIRAAFKNIKTIEDMSAFLPQSLDGRMPEGWANLTKQRLIANGTYNKDGTLNMETAERVGWAQKWRDAAEQAKAAAAKKAAAEGAGQQ